MYIEDDSPKYFYINDHYFLAVPVSESAAIGSSGIEPSDAGSIRFGGVFHRVVEAGAAGEPTPRPPSPASLLTDRELQIAYSVVDGNGDKAIAFELGISQYTVREHLRRMFHKLNVTNRATLVARMVLHRG